MTNFESPKPIKRNNKFMSLSVRDLVRGAVTAGVTATIAGLTDMVRNGALPSRQDVQLHVASGILAFIGYILLNLFTNSEGKLLKKEGK